MKNLHFKSLKISLAWLFIIALSGPILASEQVIQEEKMVFDKCLNVISVSEDKLSISPKILDVNDQKRIAVFDLSDGELTITCDGEKGLVTVSTKMN